MIKVRCRTNIDKFKGEVWPTEIACRPLKGDAVQAESGVVLHVVGVTHAKGPSNLLDTGIAGQPFLKIELHRYYPALDEPRS